MRFVTYSAAEGLGNRLRTHLVAHAYAIRCKAALIVNWPVVKACGATYSDLFLPSKGVLDASTSLYARIVLQTLSSRKIRFNYCQEITAADVNDLPRPRYGLVEFGEAFRPFGYENNGKFLGSYGNCVLKSLQPVPAIVESISEFASQNIKPLIGVHIRRGDFHISFPDSLLSLEFYEYCVHKISEVIPSALFFLSCDDYLFIKPLLDSYNCVTRMRSPRQSPVSAQHVFGYDNRCNRDTVLGVREALVDILLLARTNVILGSPQSSFSMIAGYLGNTEVVLPIDGSRIDADRCVDQLVTRFIQNTFE